MIGAFRRLAAAGAVLVVTTAGPWAEAAQADSGTTAASQTKQSASSAAQSIHDVRSQTLSFGIDSQILDLLQTLTQEKDGTLDPEVEKLFETSLNTDVRQASLELLRQVKDWNLAAQAAQVVSGYINSGSTGSESLVLTAIRYLRDAKGQQAIPLFTKLVNDQSQSIASAAIDALGMSGDPSVSGMLINQLKDPSFPTALKAQTILALGDLKPKEAVPVLTQILKNPDADSVLRQYACNSLGLIGDPASVPVIEQALSASDSYLRAYAVSALGHFQGSAVDDKLMQALKDSFWRVRVSAAESLGTRKVSAALPILEYKAKYDPEPNVERAAVGAIGDIGGTEGYSFLRTILANPLINQALRETAADKLIANDLRGSLSDIEKVIHAEWSTPNSRFLDYLCHRLSEAKDPSLKSLFATFLSSPNINIEIYGLRGIRDNHFTDLLSQIEHYDSTSMPTSVRATAESAIQALK